MTDKLSEQREKTLQLIEDLNRDLDELQRLSPAKADEHTEAIASCKFLLKIAKRWK